ncbi:hypothetical protein NKH77_48395 [Streptomyces sp. M19]
MVHGRSGRMARLIADAVADEPDLDLLGRTATRGPAPRSVLDETAAAGERSVVVDFTAREATAALLEHALSVPCALVIGTSGLGGRSTRCWPRSAAAGPW